MSTLKLRFVFFFLLKRFERHEMTIFERIKELSKKRNISVKELALQLGFSENLFYRWKTTNPKADDLAKVADYFNVSVDYLLGRGDEAETRLLTEQEEKVRRRRLVSNILTGKDAESLKFRNQWLNDEKFLDIIIAYSRSNLRGRSLLSEISEYISETPDKFTS